MHLCKSCRVLLAQYQVGTCGDTGGNRAGMVPGKKKVMFFLLCIDQSSFLCHILKEKNQCILAMCCLMGRITLRHLGGVGQATGASQGVGLQQGRVLRAAANH